MRKAYPIIELILALSIVGGLLIHFHFDKINDFPSSPHAWAKADRLALSKGFLRNGMDFFHPETYVMNKQFPGEFKVGSDNSRTAVDFPIHDYIPAVIMKVFGTDDPWPFRAYCLLMTVIGMGFLFCLARNVTGNPGIALFVVLFALCIPVYASFQAGFIPTIPALAWVFAGIYYFQKSLKNGSRKDRWLAMILIGVAALSRTPFAIPLIAWACLEFLDSIMNRRLRLDFWVGLMLVAAMILGYFGYNGVLREEYGSLFLSKPLPPDSWETVTFVLNRAWEKFGFVWLSGMQYVILLVLMIIGCISLFFMGPHLKSWNSATRLATFSIIWLTGSFMYTCLMLIQLDAHEYYVLDTLLVPILVMAIVILGKLRSDLPLVSWISGGVAVFLGFVMIGPASEYLKKIDNPGPMDAFEIGKTNFRTAGVWLDDLGVSKEDKVLIMPVHGPNIPFSLIDRKGFALVVFHEEFVTTALNMDWDYAIVQNRFLVEEILPAYPTLPAYVELVADNNLLSLFKKRGETKEDNSFVSMLDLDKRIPFFKLETDFDTDLPQGLEMLEPLDSIGFQGSRGIEIGPEMEFSMAWGLNWEDLEGKGNIKLLLKGKVLKEKEDLVGFQMIGFERVGPEVVFYQDYELGPLLGTGTEWQDFQLTFDYPEIKEEGAELRFHIWNPGKNKIQMDNLEILLFRDDYRLSPSI